MRAYFWILLMSLFPDSFSKIQELKAGVDFPGDDVLHIYSPDVQHCQLACTQHHSCLFFTYLRSDWSKDNNQFYCHLKHSASGLPSRVVDLNGLTSGFSLSSNDQTDACLSSVYHDIDFPGSDYLQLVFNTFDECQKQCTSDQNCNFFSFITDTFPDIKRRNQCFLKFSWTIPLPPEIKHTPGVISGFSDSVYKTNGSKKECNTEILVNNDYNGNDFESILAVSPQHCQFLCSTHPRCTHFSYTSSKFLSNTWYQMRCFLKNVENVNQLVPQILEDVYSGLPTRNCELSNAWKTISYGSMDFYGYDNDYRYLLTDTSESCRKMCTSDPYCQFYTYVLPSFHDQSIRHRCFMKQVMILPRPEKVVNMHGVVSGFSLRNCNPGKESNQ